MFCMTAEEHRMVNGIATERAFLLLLKATSLCSVDLKDGACALKMMDTIDEWWSDVLPQTRHFLLFGLFSYDIVSTLY